MPAFWYHPPDRPGLTARLLAPLGQLCAAVTAKAGRAPARLKLANPVISVEPLPPGGEAAAAAIALVQHMQGAGHAAVIACQGGRNMKAGAMEVDPRRHDAGAAGAEAVLIAAFTRVWVARDASLAARGAADAAGAGSTIIALEDGWGPGAIEPDLTLLVADAIRGFGNGLCWPAGPLRESLAATRHRADLLLSVGPPKAQRSFMAQWGGALALPPLQGQYLPLETGMDWRGTRLLAFAGMENPQGFFAALKGLGAELVRAEALSGSGGASRALLLRLEEEARARRAQLVTTEKDAARLPADFRSKVLTLPFRVQIDDTAPLDRALAALR